MMDAAAYDANGMPKCDANYVPLSPISFLPRDASAYGDRTSIIYGSISFTWRQTYERCCRLAAALQQLAVSRNDVVSVLAPNTPALYEMHFAVPMAGAVLNAINTRLDAANVAAILKHAEPKVVVVDYEYLAVATEALSMSMSKDSRLVLVVVDDNDMEKPPPSPLTGWYSYEQLVAHGGDPARHPPRPVADEWDAISLNYTSGTTAAPKGVVYSHRGAYLSTLALLLQWGVGHEPVYLWSLPMFHCNGWMLTWGVAACGGTNVCIRSPTAAAMSAAFAAHGVTHMCAAPVLFHALLALPAPLPRGRTVRVLTGGAPPPAALLQRVERLGFHVTHAYGMTEATGVATVCEWRPQWDALPPAERAHLKARQGVSALSLAGGGADVVDLSTGMKSVPRDGATLGEIVLRGSNVMKGYLKDPGATAAAFRGGRFRTGDVGVVHPDGYVEIKDRSKDVIISGGENISSVDVEAALYQHPAVQEAAVVAMPHPYWGETPCAFVALKTDMVTTEEDILSFCRNKLPHFMAPRMAVFLDELPKNATGKLNKLELRQRAQRLAHSRRKTTTAAITAVPTRSSRL